jgi:thioredoxin reductase (NADPH)
MLRADVLEGFKKAGIARNYQAEEPIFLANEPSTGMYLILKGEVKVVRRNEAGEQVEVAHMGPGQTMGEISLLLGQPHSATVIAKNEVETLLLTQTKLDELRRIDSDLALRLYEILAFTLAGHLMDVNRQLASARREIGQLKKKIDEQAQVYSYF